MATKSIKTTWQKLDEWLKEHALEELNKLKIRPV